MKTQRNVRMESRIVLLGSGTQPGGRRESMTEPSQRTIFEQVMLACNAPDGASRLKVNRRLIVDHVYGKLGSALVAPIQCIGDFTLVQGASNGGSKVLFPGDIVVPRHQVNIQTQAVSSPTRPREIESPPGSKWWQRWVGPRIVMVNYRSICRPRWGIHGPLALKWRHCARLPRAHEASRHCIRHRG